MRTLSDKGQTDPMGWDMGLLRRLLWPRRDRDDEEEEPHPRRKGKSATPGTYRVEIDGESKHLKGEGPPFSFWASSRIILIIAFLLWWIQPAGPMIAGYVGGRRAGSPVKAVVAALMPIVVIYLAILTYAHLFAAQHVDFVGSLPEALGGGAASILPFLAPYKDFMIAYMQSFVGALQTTFGMGTNGYLMVIIFAYIGGLIAEQTRRELGFRSGASQTVGFNLIQPLFGRPRPVEASGYEAEGYEEEDEELESMRRPARAHARSTRGSHRPRRRGQPAKFEEYQKVGAETLEGHGGRRGTRGRRTEEEDDETPVRAHRPNHALGEERHGRARASEADEDEPEGEDVEAVARREAKEARQPRRRSHEEEVAIQRFVERALRNYDHSKS